MNRRLLTALGAASLLVATLLPATVSAADPQIQGRLESPVSVSGPSPITSLDRTLVGATGAVDVVVRLKAQPTAKVRGNAAREAQLGRIKTQQDGVWGAIRAADATATKLGATRVALNALLVRVDATKIAQLARDERVLSINRVRDYQLELTETVPHIGASALHETPPGVTGDGVVVAVLDSGVDYTHASLGGPGTVDAYLQAYGTKTKHTKNQKINDRYKGALLYPTAKVIGGWDFVGEAWSGGAGSPPLAPDPDPIDCSPSAIGCDGGHGTHVADIIAGTDGVAPGADILAVKVCSSVSTACSGVALIQGMDFALDPNRDGLPTDRADIINMSLGALYGQWPDDDLSAAVESATAIGTLTVAAAGNGGDRPYVQDTPAAAPSALAVAQTAVPSSIAFAMFIQTSTGEQIREAVHQPWSKEFTAADAVSGATVQYGDGAGGNLNGCAAFPAGSLADKVVLVDRGACDFSLKISNIAAGGAKIGIIGLIAAGDPFAGGLGACPDGLCATIPGFMVSQSTANLLKNPANTLDFDPAEGVPLINHMVGSSSRGPDNATNLLKPEIGAPGASVSALVGTGTGTEPFSGTSGATPMVAGSAALLREAYPGRGPIEIKAALINTGYTDIFNKPEIFGGGLAPITRIGGGEVRVDRAWATDAAAWEDGGSSSALSFGFHDVTDDASITKTVRVRNYGSSSITYDIASTFRFADDETNGAVDVDVSPTSITLPPSGSATFDVTVTIDGAALRGWGLDSGLGGNDAASLTTLEYDGYVWLDAEGEENDIHLPWQTLPRQAAAVTPSATSVASGGSIELANAGAGTASVTSLALVATSPDDPDTGAGDAIADVDLRYVGVRSIPGALLGCDAPIALTFGVTTWDRQVHANAPALFEFDLDLDQDGTFDYAVYNFDLSNTTSLSDGRNVVFAQDLATGDATAFFGTGHSTNSVNTQLTVCGEQLGLDATAIGSSVDVLALAADWYNSGAVTDFAEFTMVLGGDRYAATFGNAGPFSPIGTVIPGGTSDLVTITDAGATGTNPTESGVLLQLDGSLFGAGGAPEDAETIVLEVTPAP